MTAGVLVSNLVEAARSCACRQPGAGQPGAWAAVLQRLEQLQAAGKQRAPLCAGLQQPPQDPADPQGPPPRHPLPHSVGLPFPDNDSVFAVLCSHPKEQCLHMRGTTIWEMRLRSTPRSQALTASPPVKLRFCHVMGDAFHLILPARLASAVIHSVPNSACTPMDMVVFARGRKLPGGSSSMRWRGVLYCRSQGMCRRPRNPRREPRDPPRERRIPRGVRRIPQERLATPGLPAWASTLTPLLPASACRLAHSLCPHSPGKRCFPSQRSQNGGCLSARALSESVCITVAYCLCH